MQERIRLNFTEIIEPNMYIIGSCPTTGSNLIGLNSVIPLSGVEDSLFAFAEKTGRVGGLLKGLTADAQMEASIEMMVVEAIKTSAIERELLSRKDVMSSIRTNLGLAPEAPGGDKRAAGAAALMIDVRSSFAAPLSEEMLLSWHRMMMQGYRHVAAGRWRMHVESMQVVSGPIGHERVHFEAPPSAQIPEEMRRYIQWFNDTAPDGKHEIRKAAVRSAIAHLYFESIHPFEGRNGRIGRALSEKALSQGWDACRLEPIAGHRSSKERIL
ncbi:MAG: DUF4172 domain-containing protein [Nitrospira sp.]